MDNFFKGASRAEFRAWLEKNHDKEKECFVAVKRGKPTGEGLYYLDAVEEALCFGWIDSTMRKVDGLTVQRFSPRRKKSNWTELNKERVRRLEKLGLMTEAGRAVAPPLDEPFKGDEEVVSALKEAGVWEAFLLFPALYQRVRLYNLAFTKARDYAAYEKSLARVIEGTKAGKTIGEWHDFGRLLDY